MEVRKWVVLSRRMDILPLIRGIKKSCVHCHHLTIVLIMYQVHDCTVVCSQEQYRVKEEGQYDCSTVVGKTAMLLNRLSTLERYK